MAGPSAYPDIMDDTQQTGLRHRLALLGQEAWYGLVLDPFQGFVVDPARLAGGLLIDGARKAAGRRLP